MEPNNLKQIIKAGLARDHFDGVRKWSRASVEGTLSPLGYKNTLSDPNILNVLKEIEAEGYIKLVRTEEIYLEILDPDAAARGLYTKIIRQQFNLPEELSKKFAQDLYDQIIAHGGYPLNTEHMNEEVRVIVGKWLKK